MMGFGIIMIIFGVVIILAGLYLVYGNKGDFTQVLLWKSNVKKMTKEDVQYTGKVTIAVAFAPIIAGVLALFLEESIIPIIALGVSFIGILILAIKIFKK